LQTTGEMTPGVRIAIRLAPWAIPHASIREISFGSGLPGPWFPIPSLIKMMFLVWGYLDLHTTDIALALSFPQSVDITILPR